MLVAINLIKRLSFNLRQNRETIRTQSRVAIVQTLLSVSIPNAFSLVDLHALIENVSKDDHYKYENVM